MLKAVASAAATGLMILALSDPASAQAARFDPGLRTASSSPIETVQFNPGGRRFVPQGSQSFRGRPGGGGGFGQYRGGGRQFGNGYRGPRYGGGGYRKRGGYGIGAGVAGLAAGALIGGAIASQATPAYGYYGGYGYGYDAGYAPPPPVVDYSYADAAPVVGDSTGYCMRRYKSYDPSSGTYLGFDGLRHPCP